MMFKGKAFKFGDNIDTDNILPAKYLSITDEIILGSHCMISPSLASSTSSGHSMRRSPVLKAFR